MGTIRPYFDLKGHSGWVRSVAIQGDRIVSGSDDGTVKVWQVSTGLLEKTLAGHFTWVCSVAIDGDRIVSSSEDGTVNVWQASTGLLEKTLTGHSTWVCSVAIQGDRIVSGSDDGTVKVWQVSTGLLKKTLVGHSEWVYSVAIQGDRVVSGSRDRKVCMWKVWNPSMGMDAFACLIRRRCNQESPLARLPVELLRLLFSYIHDECDARALLLPYKEEWRQNVIGRE